MRRFGLWLLSVLGAASIVLVGATPALAYDSDIGQTYCGNNQTPRVTSRTVFETYVTPPQSGASYYYGHTWFTKRTFADFAGAGGWWYVDATNYSGQVDEANTYGQCITTGSRPAA